MGNESAIDGLSCGERFALVSDDMRTALAAMPECSIHACVTDPPYELGFMGRAWDRSGVAFDPDAWRAVLRVLRPGGHLVAFGGTRTWHRIACAIEDAGFEIRDCIAWMFGSGFPKSLDVSKAIDKRRDDARDVESLGAWLRARRESRGLKQKDVAAHWPSATGGLTGCVANWELGFNCPTMEQWSQLREILGFGYEMDAECARLNERKGQVGKVWAEAEVVGEYDGEPGGFGDHRFRVRDNLMRAPSEAAQRWRGWGTALKPAFEPVIIARRPLDGTVAENVQRWGTGTINIDGCRVNGRWPPNVILDDEAAAMLDAQSGGASRFFYTAKADGSERDAGLEDLPTFTSGELTDRTEGSAGLNNPRAGAGRTSGRKNMHPTVKPIDVMRYLCRLVTPPDGVVLDPFTGSGTTGVAAIAEGFRFYGVEMETPHAVIAWHRISRWASAQIAPGVTGKQAARAIRKREAAPIADLFSGVSK